MLVYRALSVVLLAATLLIYTPDRVVSSKCSLLEYTSATFQCVSGVAVQYARALAGHLINRPVYAEYSKTDIWSVMMDATKNNCRRGTFDTWRKCQSEVDAMCERSRSLSVDSLWNIIDIICDRTSELKALSTCFKARQIGDLGCLRTLEFDASRPKSLRSFTTDSQKCFESAFASCPDGTRDTIKSILNELSYKKPCSHFEYEFTTYLCWSKFAFKLKEKLGDKSKRDDVLKSVFCDDDLKMAMSCQSALDSQCGESIVNMKEAASVAATLCAVGDFLRKLPKCANPAAFGLSLSELPHNEHLSGNYSTCQFFDQVKQSYDSVFKGCSGDVRAAMSSVFGLVTPGPCKNSQAGCTSIEHAAGTSLCWATPVVNILADIARRHRGSKMSAYRYDTSMTSMTKDISENVMVQCTDGSPHRAYRCHRNIDQMCSMSLVTPEKMRTLAESVCHNTADIQRIAPCMKISSRMMSLRCQKYGTVLDTQDKICRHFSFSVDCMMENTRDSDDCTPGVREILKDFVNTIVPGPCSATSRLVPSILLSFFVFAATALSVSR